MAKPPNLKSKTARAALRVRREPYWHCIRVGLYVGYRRVADGEGTWLGRRLHDGTKKYLLRSFGPLSGFDEASAAVEAWAAGVNVGATHRASTVVAACKAYVAHLRARKGKAAAADAEGRFLRLVYGKPIGAAKLDKLSTPVVRAWLNDQVVVDDDSDDEDIRRSKDSANRNLTALKAALNLAARERLVASDAGWKTVEAFPKVGKRRDRYLSIEERKALLEKSGSHLATLVRMLLLTGVRPGELANANVGDFDNAQGTLGLSGKTGTRTVTLSTAATKALSEQAKGKPPTTPLLLDPFGNRWNKDGWKKGFKAAVAAAELPGDVVLYTLRHVAISEMIAGGMDAFLVAKLAGTSTAMIDKHYGHLRHHQTRARLDAISMM